MQRTAGTINSVPADQYGCWCHHGRRIMVPDPADQSDYPALIFADPWPCDQGCTVAEIERQMQEENDEYEADRWREYWDMCAEGMTGTDLHYTNDRYDPGYED